MARIVMEDRFGLSLTDICMGKDKDLSANESQEVEKIAQRLLSGEPVQYVVGSAAFCGNRFVVRPGVLIPRPETAFLVDFAMRKGSRMKPYARILDICTGSGCIAVSVAKALPSARVAGWDISEEALKTAKENAALLHMDVDFAFQDALNPPHDTGEWDIIVSNPPYIARREAAAMERNVLDYEPHLALFVSDDAPTVFHHSIAAYAESALRDGGFLAMEINPLFAEEAVCEVEKRGFSEVGTVRDQFGKERFVVGKKGK